MTRSLESLFERYRTRGDVSALAKIFDRTATELLRIAMHLVRDPATAEDLLQETFLAAMENAKRFDRSRPLVPWLVGILGNQARRRRRSDGRRPDPTRLPTRGEPQGVGELQANVAQGIDALPARYRQIVLLKLGFGMEPAAIAHLLDMPPATVRTRLHRGLEKLRERLPAGLALGLLPPLAGLRGLDAIREAVVSHASATAVTTTAVSTAALWTLGGVVVTKGKLMAAVIVLGLAVGGGVLLQRGWTSDDPRDGKDPASLTATKEQGPELHVRDAVENGALATKSGRARDGAPEPASKAWHLSGRVLDPGENAVPGARVEAWLERGDVITPLPPTEADAEGNYGLGLDILATWSALQRASATLNARARAPGFRPSEPVEFNLVDFTDRVDPKGDITLEPGVSVEGRVLDAARDPVAKAWVALYRVPRDGQDWYARTDKDGRYALGTDAAGTYAVAVRSARGVARSEAQRVEIGAPARFPDLVLSEGFSIRGRVLARDGSGLPGVSLYASATSSANGTKPPKEAGKHQVRARTDANGRFRLHSLWDGRYKIRLHGSLTGDAPTVASMGDHEVVIRVSHPALVVRVVDEKGRPLPGAELSHLGWRGKYLDIVDRVQAGSVTLKAARAVTNASSYGKLLAPDGTTTTFVQANSRWIVSARIVGAVPAEATVRIQEGDAVVRSDLVIRPAIPHGRLDLRVLKPDGTQLKDFSVELTTPLGMGMGTSWSDAEGVLLPVEAGPRRIGVQPYGSGSRLTRDLGLGTFLLPGTASAVKIPPQGRAAATVRLREGGRFRLQLQYPDGKLPKKDRIRLRIFERDASDEPFQYGGMWVYGEGKGRRITSVFNPAVACLNSKLLPPDDFRIEVRTQKHGTHERTIRIRAGEIIDVVLDLRK